MLYFTHRQRENSMGRNIRREACTDLLKTRDSAAEQEIRAILRRLLFSPTQHHMKRQIRIDSANFNGNLLAWGGALNKKVF